RAFLQPVNRRVLAINVVANLRLRHRPPHLRSRPRHGIAPQVHHLRRSFPCYPRGQMIRIPPLISLRHRITHVLLVSVDSVLSMSSVLKTSFYFTVNRPVPSLTALIPQTPHL